MISLESFLMNVWLKWELLIIYLPEMFPCITDEIFLCISDVGIDILLGEFVDSCHHNLNNVLGWWDYVVNSANKSLRYQECNLNLSSI
jgi:hypothetical protein